MSKRKGKKPIRSEFTDALSEEISARKIMERAQSKDEEISVDVKVETKTVEEPPDVEFAVEFEDPKVNLKKELPPPNIEIQPETPLEEKIFAEADNTFFDDPQTKKSTDAEKSNQSTYRSRALRKWQEELESEEPPPNPVEEAKEQPKPKLSRAEKAGIVISVAMLVYSFITLDKPLFFLAFSLFVHLLRQPVSGMCGKYEKDVQNAMRSFSIVLFFGALLFLFMST